VTDAGVDVALAVSAVLFCAENPELAGGVETYTPPHRDTPDSTVTKAHSNVRFAWGCGGTTRGESPELAGDPEPVGAVGPCRPIDASRLPGFDVVE
jgi:hypothetical protein